MPTVDTSADAQPHVDQERLIKSGDRRLIPWLFVAILACLLASFPIRNADIYSHLAFGRDQTQGVINLRFLDFPKNPYVKHHRFDRVTLAIFEAWGGLGLGIFKSLAVALLGISILACARKHSGWLISVFASGLAILAISSRVLYQPATFSYVFLGLFFWLTQMIRIDLLRTHKNKKFYLVLFVALGPPLMLVWAGSDQWYMLGILLFSACGVGRQWDQKSKGKSRYFILQTLCILLASIVPFVLDTPTELFASGPMPGGTKGVMTPFSRAYVEAMADSPAGLAFFPLFGLSALSFVLTFRNWSWSRFLPWAIFAALASYQVRTVPFFAVVAGPILAWNLQDFFASRQKTSTGEIANSLFARMFGQLVVTLLGLAFLASAWVGWLQSPPFEPRRLGIEISPSLEDSAKQMKLWNAEGKLGKDPRVLHLSATTRNVFAWFCPELKWIKNEELAALIRGEQELTDDLDAILKSNPITHIVVYDQDRAKLMSMLDRLFDASSQWSLIRLQGRVSIFAWRNPDNLDTANQKLLDGLTPDELVMASGNIVGDIVDNGSATNLRWWHAFWKKVPPSFDDRDEASVRLLQSEVIRRNAFSRHAVAWEATQLAGTIASISGWSNVPGALSDVNQRLIFQRPGSSGPNRPLHPLAPLARAYFPEFTRFREDSPVSLLYLAIRSARQALVRNPRDAQAYANLGEAYLRLLNNSRERGWAAPFNELVQLRRAQAIEALNRAVELDKDMAFAHSQLGAIYREMGFLDLSLEHTRAYLGAIRKSRKVGIANDDLLKAMAGAEEMLDREAKIVEQNRAEFDKSAVGLKVLDRAILARELGLAGLARDILLKSDISAFGATGLSLELELLVKTGRAREVRDWTSDEQEEALGANYRWLRVQAFAATGEYALARAECTQLGAEGDETGGSGPRLVSTVVIAQAICDGHRVLDSTGLASLNVFGQASFRNRLSQLLSRIRRNADSHALRGLLSLEMGDSQIAVDEFRKALVNWRGSQNLEDGTGVDFNSRFMCQKALEWMESTDPVMAR